MKPTHGGKRPPSPPLTPAGFFPMKLILLIAAIYAALVAVNHLNPGPGEADVRGDAVTVGSDTAQATQEGANSTQTD